LSGRKRKKQIRERARRYTGPFSLRFVKERSQAALVAKQYEEKMEIKKARIEFWLSACLAPGAGLEPATWWLTATRSTD